MRGGSTIACTKALAESFPDENDDESALYRMPFPTVPDSHTLQHPDLSARVPKILEHRPHPTLRWLDFPFVAGDSPQCGFFCLFKQLKKLGERSSFALERGVPGQIYPLHPAMFGEVRMLGMASAERVYTEAGGWRGPHGPAWLWLSAAAGQFCQGPLLLKTPRAWASCHTCVQFSF